MFPLSLLPPQAFPSIRSSLLTYCGPFYELRGIYNLTKLTIGFKQNKTPNQSKGSSYCVFPYKTDWFQDKWVSKSHSELFVFNYFINLVLLVEKISQIPFLPRVNSESFCWEKWEKNSQCYPFARSHLPNRFLCQQSIDIPNLREIPAPTHLFIQ